MQIAKRRCEFCHKWFTPYHGTYRQQKCCPNAECRKKRKVRTKRTWWLNNPGYNRDRLQKIRVWAKEYPDYWQKYRQEHPDYVKKDNKRRHTSHKKGKNAAKQDLLSKISVERLKSTQESGSDYAAKQDLLQRRQNIIINYLLGKDFAAKQDVIDNLTGNSQ